MQQDIPLFEDLLRSVDSEDGVLMINSPGGSGEAAEKILLMCRKRFTKSFRVIVPDFAKSAATMIALGSDKILMGYLSELGPIDPQFMTGPIGPGIPARSLIDGLEIIREKVKAGDPIQLYYPMLSQIRPELIARAQSAIDESKEFAEKWLKQYQLKDNPKQAEMVAEWLSASDSKKKYKSHGKVLDVDECANELKLNVECLPQDSELWNKVWELYSRSIFFLQQQPVSAKLFENDKVSLTMNIAIQQAMQHVQQMEPPKNQPPKQLDKESLD
jgi:membrane-bound ClpP family serine protease